MAFVATPLFHRNQNASLVHLKNLLILAYAKISKAFWGLRASFYVFKQYLHFLLKGNRDRNFCRPTSK
jgi:hypothetical protein